MTITKKRYILGFFTVVAILAVVRIVWPQVAGTPTDSISEQSPASGNAAPSDSIAPNDGGDATQMRPSADGQQPTQGQSAGHHSHSKPSRFFAADGSEAHHRIISVPSYAEAFPDQNDVQLISARRWGVRPVQNRADAEHRGRELVYVGANPYFHVDRLRSSIPYLVPRASVLMQDIGRAYFDSLQIKGIPLHKLIITSALRSKDDVEQLRSHNQNATPSSCHLYGTTFDVCYNRYKTVQAPGEHRREVRNDTLKWVLAEVLHDMRTHGRCHVKYEVHQGCFHITVR